jgi:malate synthase
LKAFESKRAEASLGSCGALVAHLGFVDVVREAFTEIGSPASLSESAPFEGAIGADDVRQALRVALHLCNCWLNGQGTADVDFAMEDLATAELSRV